MLIRRPELRRPFTEIIVGPKRKTVEFEEENEARSMGDMIANPKIFGKVANQSVGWQPLAPGAYFCAPGGRGGSLPKGRRIRPNWMSLVEYEIHPN